MKLKPASDFLSTWLSSILLALTILLGALIGTIDFVLRRGRRQKPGSNR
jgi:hypothetical protein